MIGKLCSEDRVIVQIIGRPAQLTWMTYTVPYTVCGGRGVDLRLSSTLRIAYATPCGFIQSAIT